MSEFTVINNLESFKFLQQLYKYEVIEFMEEPRIALMNKPQMDKLIQVGKDVYCDFWSIVKETFGETFAIEVKQKYSAKGGNI